MSLPLGGCFLTPYSLPEPIPRGVRRCAWGTSSAGPSEFGGYDRWSLGESPCATEWSDSKKSGWYAGGCNHYNVSAPAVAARRRPLGAASQRLRQTLSEAAAANIHNLMRAARADSSRVEGRGIMCQTHTRCAMGAGIDLRATCFHFDHHACRAGQSS